MEGMKNLGHKMRGELKRWHGGLRKTFCGLDLIFPQCWANNVIKGVLVLVLVLLARVHSPLCVCENN